jgi:hypothetical protein
MKNQKTDPIDGPIDTWLFRVDAYPGESFGHFLGRFRRVNDLTSGQLSTMLGLRYLAISYWETPSRRRIPSAKDWEVLSGITGVDVAQLQSMLMPKKISLYLRTRLCASCYQEEPFHRLNWQRANVTKCDRHGCELLSMCPQCGIDFKLPALWAVGECEQCSLPFAKMNDFHRSAERSFSSYIF